MGRRFGGVGVVGWGPPRATGMGQRADSEVCSHISGEGVHATALTSRAGFNICCADDL